MKETISSILLTLLVIVSVGYYMLYNARKNDIEMERYEQYLDSRDSAQQEYTEYLR
jgi:uncharacterized protein YxeA